MIAVHFLDLYRHINGLWTKYFTELDWLDPLQCNYTLFVEMLWICGQTEGINYADLEKMDNLPVTRLILLGADDTLGQWMKQWMISMEDRVTCEGVQPQFTSGFAAVFSLYSIFNLQYQEETACTLEFLQRHFVGINPEEGTKAARGNVTSKKLGSQFRRRP